MARSFRLIIFDNDGVLVDSEPIAADVLSALLTQEGLPTTHERALHDFIGSGLRRVRRVSERRLGRALPADFEDRYHERLFQRFRRELRPVEGVGEALRRIETPKCVASSGSPERIRLALERTGLWEEFDGAVFSADDVARGKPAPDLFLHAAERMGVPPTHCAVVEDSPLGIEAANAAGMTSFAYAGRTPRERLASASGGVFVDMRELPRLLRMGGRREPPPGSS